MRAAERVTKTITGPVTVEGVRGWPMPDCAGDPWGRPTNRQPPGRTAGRAPRRRMAPSTVGERRFPTSN